MVDSTQPFGCAVCIEEKKFSPSRWMWVGGRFFRFLLRPCKARCKRLIPLIERTRWIWLLARFPRGERGWARFEEIATTSRWWLSVRINWRSLKERTCLHPFTTMSKTQVMKQQTIAPRDASYKQRFQIVKCCQTFRVWEGVITCPPWHLQAMPGRWHNSKKVKLYFMVV